ncbi:acetoacetate--CoA ligase [Fluoribacter dumoffii]|uniref:acetoacetate--CoA ligase n=1 Tax=Fluoribacter dumoffii TaxID=463 RepID=UPI002243D336|nr:acetoacetate--CoA ligase [Fluoribacter dumoffii]MCW8418276.1 acetoacetate--CoA ligase [Fluoribacter dumoffii]MCW8453882.1 acetoacetate--CoA ligase [Fluoribacter dumoffii]MCW8462047.1 acetoacetate--CoA ligase [Fluoribacter dumoffii]MCW8482259.1 acetoacetate--CoA ligase [Fluoribacter dumoffii]
MNEAVWKPKHPKESRMWHFMDFAAQKNSQIFENYQDLHTWSIKHPDSFWPTLCEFFHLTFDTAPYQILSHKHEMINARWFAGAQFNFAEKLLSRKDKHPALISINEDNNKLVVSYEQLHILVAQCAAGLKSAGISAGDRVAALMPNTHHTIVAMLATTSLGAIWSSCSPDFGAQAAIDRLGQIDPQVLFICDGHQYQGKRHNGSEKIKQLNESIASLKQIVICPNINEPIDCSDLPKARYWDDFLRPATHCDFVSLPFDHPVYIMFSSGTTGKPKCIIHGAGGTLLQHIKELGLHTDLRDKDNLCFYTTCGWMMWNWTVSALALGATLTLYEGSPTYPKSDRLFKLLEEEQVTVFGTSAKFISSIEKAGVNPKDEFDMSHLRCILSTGSPLLPKNYDYVYEQIKDDVQLCSISGGTDIISCFALGNPILPIYRGELQCIGLGMAVDVFDEQGHSIRKERGELVCTAPFPSMPIGFWNDPDKKAYQHAYFERFSGIWAHGDFAEITAHHGLIIYGRSDAVLNPGGVRIGTAEIYRQVEKINEVIDSIVIAQDWQDDVRIVLFVKLRENTELTEELINKIRLTIRQNASPRHVPAKILQVADIPRTISGKIVEVAVRQVVHGLPVNNLQSLANPQALEYFKNREELKI